MTYMSILFHAGVHTVGVTHCSVIHDRLYNFNGTGLPDPTMDPTYAWILKTFACPKNPTFDNIVFLDDPSSILIVDKSYYTQIRKRRGVLAIDQELGDDSSTGWMVDFLDTTNFFPSMFSSALNKLSALDVKTGGNGEIRKNCQRTN
jgi:peroxidase